MIPLEKHFHPSDGRSTPVTVDRWPGRLAGALKGFSLVEVVLAIGLVMFAALVIFSLMPVGLFSLQEANRQIVETEIFNTVGAELVSTPFDRLTNYQTTRFPIYFNNEGIEVAADTNSPFIVRGSAPVAEPGGELNRVTISIGYRRDPAQTNANSKVSKRTFLLVNRGI
ncbi:MAG: hypothetical protein ACOYMS_01455 [Terrimicrobiaceae bacterium]